MQRFFPFIKEILHIYTSCLTDYTHFVVLRVEAVEGLAPSSTQLSLRGAVWVEPCLECATSVYLLGDWAYCAIIEFFTFKIITSAYR